LGFSHLFPSVAGEKAGKLLALPLFLPLSSSFSLKFCWQPKWHSADHVGRDRLEWCLQAVWPVPSCSRSDKGHNGMTGGPERSNRRLPESE
jgi:hypothetical protein